MCEVTSNFIGDSRCQNESACEEFSLSWGLPYEYYPKENLLVVQNTTFIYYWEKEVLRMNWNCKVCPINGMEAGNYDVAPYSSLPINHGNISIDSQMKIEMQKAGWMAAVPIKKPDLKPAMIFQIKEPVPFPNMMLLPKVKKKF